MDPVELVQATMDSWAQRVRAVKPEQWTLATPCEAWDVRALVNHVVGEDRWAPPLLAGRTIADVGDRFDGDLLGVDPQAAHEEAVVEARAAWSEPGAGVRTVHLSYGDERAGEYAMQLAADHLVHGWDVAAATGQDRTLPGDQVDPVAEWFAERESLYRSAGMIAEPTPLAGGATAQDRLLAAFGRDPGWSA
jgi:uncharacterized protein (TIGR03086 family)